MNRAPLMVAAMAVCVAAGLAGREAGAQTTPSGSAELKAGVFASARTKIAKGETIAIPFTRAGDGGPMNGPTVANPAIARVLNVVAATATAPPPPATLSGTPPTPPAADSASSLGFIRVRAEEVGITTVSYGGGSIEVEVVSATTPGVKRAGVRIVNPATGAAAWGVIGIGVEFFDDRREGAGEGSTGEQLILLSSDGREFKPVAVTSLDQGPTRHALFEVDIAPASASPPALLTLRAAWMRPGARPVQSEPVTVYALAAMPTDLAQGEAEARYDVERPKRFSERHRSVSTDSAASGGKFLNNAGSVPALCFPVKADAPGWYQVILTARGTLAGTAYPSVGVYVDEGEQPITNGRITSETWRRFTLGVPIRLDAGAHVVTTYFENDFYVERLADRNLGVDKIEVLRLPESMGAGGAGRGGAGGDAMMGGAMMSGEMTKDASAGAAMMAAPAAGGGGEGGMMMADGGGAMSSMKGSSGGAGQAGGAGSGAVNVEAITRGGPLRIAFTQRFDGLPAGGELQVEGVCWWEGERRSAGTPPRVTLMVNDAPIGIQRSAMPRFVVDAKGWKAGENTVQLIARLDSGVVARTPAVRVMWSIGGGAEGAVAPNAAAAIETDANPAAYVRRFERFTIHDEAWEPGIKSTLQTEKNPPEGRAAMLASNSQLVLRLPEGLTGEFEVQLESFGQEFQGPPIASAALVSEAGTTKIGETGVQGWWSPRTLGRVRLNEGANSINIAFTNDRYEEGKGDRNLYFQAVVLREVDGGKDATPPWVRVVYPAGTAAGTAGGNEGANAGASHDVYMQDVLIADVADNVGVTRVELLVDGKPTGVALNRALKPGRVVVPVIARSLSAGVHTLGVRVVDGAGNATDSQLCEIHVVASAPDELLPYERAVRLLSVLAWGPDEAELTAVLTMGEREWLTDRLGRDLNDPAELAALAHGMTRFTSDRGEYDVPRRALSHAILTPNPVRARFVLWTENHFSTWIRKVEADRKWDEHVAYSRAGVAPFRELLRVAATSPAMLRYLDQERSYAGQLNENYAREIMELHTLGVRGGYTQADVTSLAKLLTGWTTARQGDGASGGEMRRDEFRFDPALSEPGAIGVLGVEFPACKPGERYERAHEALDVLAAHPSTARFIARKLVEHYAFMPAPDDLVDAVARSFLESGGDMRVALLTLASREELFRREAPERLAHPLGYALRLARTTAHVNPWGIGDYLQRSGVGLFDRSTPDGYPEEDSAYMDSNAVLQRWRFAQDMWWQIAELAPEEWRWGTWSSKTPEDAEVERWAQGVVDVIAVKVTGRVLSAESNSAALRVARDSTGNKQDRLQALVPFVAQLPEFSLR